MTDERLPLGTRVELHPASDAWMAGDRYGEVVGNQRRLTVRVKMDRSGRTLCLVTRALTVVAS